MKHLLKDITLTAICLMAAIKASAYDFEENDICYNILSEADKTCEVTHRDNYNIYFYFGEISIPQVANGYKVTAIGTSAFYGCDGLTSIEIPQGVTSIGSSAFCGCNGLTSIEIPQGVTDIGDDTFNGCFRLTSIEIPQGVTYIGEAAFSGCNGLKSVTSLSTIPPVAAYRAFDLGQQHDNDTLYVPAGSLEAYKNANEWEDFEIIIELAPTGIESATADGQLSVAATGNGISVSGAKGAVEVYTVGGALLTRTTATGGRTEIALPARGLYLVKVGKQILKVKR